MLALLFARRETGDAAYPHEIGVEIREFGCFNGFNRHQAFMVGSHGDYFSVVYKVDALGRGVFDNDHVRSGVRIENRGQWTTLGIGWLSESSPRIVLDQNTPTSHQHPGAILNRECGMPKYYDGFAGVWKETKRPLTPNEVIIGNSLWPLLKNEGNTAVNVHVTGCVVPEYSVARANEFLRSVAWNRAYGHMSFDFVGSERPSGMAVAYLQVYRNASRHLRSAQFAHQDPTVLGQLRVLNNSSLVSLIPLLSDLYNSGDDSDILSYTGESHLVMTQGCIHGVFSLTPFFRVTSSMLAEGLYNKGGQSSSLGRNLRAAVRRHNFTVREEAWSESVLSPIMAVGSLLSSAANVLNLRTLIRMGGANWLREAQTIANRAGGIITANAIARRIEVLVSQHQIDLRDDPRPTVDHSAVQAHAQGFVQWVQQNDEALGQVTTRPLAPSDAAQRRA